MADTIRLRAIKGTVLGLTVYRGFGKLSELARISRADIYDQNKNPKGTQRDLSRKHARDAYNYVAGRPLAFYPEIVLNLRRDAGVRFERACSGENELGYLYVDLSVIKRARDIVISRVDGNHRLWYSDGQDVTMPPLDQEVSFCLIYGLKAKERDAELLLFRDINANQVGMNTSHLDSIRLRTSTSDLKSRDPLLYIAERLMEDQDSPFHGKIYRGGVKPAGSLVPLRTLKTSVEYLKSRSKKLDLFQDVDTQSALIKNYWSAVKRWLPDAWSNPKDYIALRATGFWAMAFIGSDVVDRAVSSGKISPAEMLRILKSGKSWNWSNAGDFRGYGGRSGAVQIANMVIGEFESEGQSIRDIEAKLKEGSKAQAAARRRTPPRSARRNR